MRHYLVIVLLALLSSLALAQPAKKEQQKKQKDYGTVSINSPTENTTTTVLRDTGAKGTVSPDGWTVYGIMFHPSDPEAIVPGITSYDNFPSTTNWTIKFIPSAPTGSGLILRVRTDQTPTAFDDEDLDVTDAREVRPAGRRSQRRERQLIAIEILRFYQDMQRGEHTWVATGRVIPGGRPLMAYLKGINCSHFIPGRCRSQGPNWDFEFKACPPGRYKLVVESTCGCGFDSREVTVR